MGVDAEMFVRTRSGYIPEQVREMAHDLAEAFGYSHFVIARPGKHSWLPQGRHALELVDVYEQDGPPIYPCVGEQFIQVHLFTRYYGKGYERGNWPFIDGVIRWLKMRIPDAEVWYGGDSSGICAELMDEAARNKLWRLFVKAGHKPYVHYDGWGHDREKPTCDFCSAPMANYLWGPSGRRGFCCHGCGLKLWTDDGGKTFYEPEDDRD